MFIRVVVNQTNTILQSIEKVEVARQRTLQEIEALWVSKDYVDHSQVEAVLADMRLWGNKESICAEKDWAYRKALRSLWARVKGNAELERRLWEECLEAVGMCAQGHLSRLANVLVGFSADAEVVVNTKELFQNAVSALARQEMGTEEKQTAAGRLFEEYAIPVGERGAWMEALV